MGLVRSMKYGSISPRIRKKGGLSTLKLFMSGHIISLCYNSALFEHGKGGCCTPFPPLGETLSMAV